MGVKHFCIGWDVKILHDWWQVNGEAMRGMLTGSNTLFAPKNIAGTY
jgi:4-hydroxy-2-oxoheptanedioate aldolase